MHEARPGFDIHKKILPYHCTLIFKRREETSQAKEQTEGETEKGIENGKVEDLTDKLQGTSLGKE